MSRVALIPWRRAVAELLIILVGVLSALALDRAFQGREDRQLERGYLERLNNDLAEDERMLQEAVAQAIAGRAAGERLLGPPGDAFTDMDVTVDSLAWTLAGFAAQPGAAGATFEELQITGNLRLLRDPRVVQALFEYHSAVAALVRRIAITQERGREPFAELLWGLGLSRYRGQDGLAPSVRSEELRAIRAHPDFAALAARAVRYQVGQEALLREWLTMLDEPRRALGSIEAP